MFPNVGKQSLTSDFPPLIPFITQQQHDDLLYVIVLAGSKVVTLLRPRRHSIHPLGVFPSHTFETSSITDLSSPCS